MAQPLFRFALSRRSILDTLFVDQASKRPGYATTTDGSMTTLWCINHRGNFSEVAQIHWQGNSATAGSSTVVVNGQVMLVDNVLQRSKSFFGSGSRTFAAGNTRCKWKGGRGSRSAFDQSRPPIRSSIESTSQFWTCHETTISSGRSTNAGTSSASSNPVLAVFVPPQTGIVKSELTVYPSGRNIVDHLILTSILICAQKDEWRSAQSAITRSALEATLKAEIRGTLPPYIPTTSSRSRVTSPPPLRRPHSTSTARTRYTSSDPPPPPPPPYTSVDDLFVPHR